MLVGDEHEDRAWQTGHGWLPGARYFTDGTGWLRLLEDTRDAAGEVGGSPSLDAEAEGVRHTDRVGGAGDGGVDEDGVCADFEGQRRLGGRAQPGIDDDALRDAANALDLTTLYGRFRLDPRTGRQVGHGMVVAQWQAGQKQIVWPPPAATAPPYLAMPAPAPTTAPSDAPPSS